MTLLKKLGRMFGKAVALVSGVVGILGFFGITASGLFAWLLVIFDFSIYWALIPLGIVLGIVLGRLIADVLIHKTEQNVKKPAKPMQLSAAELRQLLPTNADLFAWFQELEEEAVAWDKNVRITEYRLGLFFNEGSILFTDASIHVESEWRKLSGYISSSPAGAIKKGVRQHFFELNTSDAKQKTTIPFYTFNDTGWRDTLIDLYGPIDHIALESLHVEVKTSRDVLNKNKATFEASINYSSDNVSRRISSRFTQTNSATYAKLKGDRT